MFDYTILGAGAVGCVYGGLLAAAGHRVQLISRRPDLGLAIANRGLCIDFDGQAIVAHPTACLAADAQPSHVVIVLTKTFQTEDAVVSARGALGDAANWVSLQNGLGNGERLNDLVGGANIYLGPVMLPARVKAPGDVWTGSVIETKLGPHEGADFSIAAQIATDFTDAGIPTAAVQDPRPVIWHKASFNLAMNAISALTKGGPGLIGAMPDLLEEAIATAMEGADVARAVGVDLDRKELARCIRLVTREHLWHRTSMSADIEEGRRTEVHSLNAYVVQKAKELGLSTPRNALLSAMISAREYSDDYWRGAPAGHG